MTTSSEPVDAPISTQAAHNRASEGAAGASALDTQKATSATRVAGRLPNRLAARPAIGIATSDPAAMKPSATPICPAPRSRRSLIAASRAAQAP
jgi:hypothetical protein